jgi:ethanolamine utilization protein EutK
MRNACGFLEVKGLAVAIEVADAMLKSANVRIVKQIKTNPALITLVVEGDIGSCRAAVDAGRALALRLNALVSEKVIGRPEPDLALFWAAPAKPAPLSESALLDFLGAVATGKRLDQIVEFLQRPESEVLAALDLVMGQGRVKKTGRRYLLA